MMLKLANTVKAEHIPMLRTVLLDMLAAGAAQSWPHMGVCGNLDRRLKAQFMEMQASYFGYDACKELAESWPHALRRDNGTLMEFFVPSDRYPTACSCGEDEQMWEWRQLGRRMLVKHMLTQLGLLEQYYNEQEAHDAV